MSLEWRSVTEVANEYIRLSLPGSPCIIPPVLHWFRLTGSSFAAFPTCFLVIRLSDTNEVLTVISSTRSSLRKSHLFCALVVAVLAVGNYILWIHNYFVADSWWLVGSISEPDWSLADLLPFRQLPHRINSTLYYAPVHTAVLWLAFKLGGFDPERYNLTLIGFHLGTTLFLFAAALQLTGSRLKATAAASIFAVHFASTEGVGWLGAITHPVAGFFGAMAFALYVRYLQTSRARWGVGAMVALLGASLTQVTALPWFAILAGLDLFYSRKRGSFQGFRQRLAVLGVLLLAMVPLQIHALRFTEGEGYHYQSGPWIVRNLFFYPVSTVVPSLEGSSFSLTRDLLLVPFDQNGFIRLVSMTDAFGLLLASGLVVVAVALLWSCGGWLSRFSLVAFFLSTTPLLLVNGQGYRYLYVPLMFFSLAVANSLVDLYRHLVGHARGAAVAVLAILPLFVALSFAESQRQLFWRQQAGLMAHRSLVQLKETQPELPKGAKIVFGGALDTIQNTNAEVWRQGLREAVKVVYGDRTLRVEGYTREEVERLFHEELKGAPNTYGFVWEDWQFKRIAP